MTTPWIRTRNRWAGLAVLGLGIPLATVLGSAFRDWPGRTFPGFFVDANRVVRFAAGSPWTGPRSDLPIASQVASIDGQMVTSNADVYDAVASMAPGISVHYVVRANAQSVARDVLTMRFGWADYVFSVGMLTASGLLFVGGAGVVALMRPDAGATFAFLLLGLANALGELGSLAMLHPAYRPLAWMFPVGASLLPATLLHFGLVFPVDRQTIQRYPWLLALAYVGAVLLATFVTRGFLADPPYFAPIQFAARLSAAVLALVIGWIAMSSSRNRKHLVRPRMYETTPGLVLASSMGLYGVLSLFQSGHPLSTALVLLTPGVIYVAIGHGITRGARSAHDVVVQRARELEEQVAERTATLQRALADLAHARAQLVQSEKTSSLGQMTAGLAHEINTPVTAVVGNVKPLWNEIARLQDRAGLYGDAVLDVSIGRLRTIVEVMARGAERTAAIVQDLRVFSRVGETTLLPMDLRESVDVSLRLLRPRWADRIAIHKEYGAVPPLEVSANQISQVLMNLLANAFDSIEGPGNVWIRTWVEDRQVLVTVRDDGRGIAAEHVERIFDPFFTTKPVGKGTGLGLAISASIVHDHGGRLSVTSDPGTGSTFALTLPLRRPAVGTPSRGAM